MISSMTGYGQGEVSRNGIDIRVELSSVNSRYCDVVFRTPRILQIFEDEFKKIIQEKLLRGRVSCTICIEKNGAEGNNLAVDESVLGKYLELIEGIKERTGISEDVKLGDILTLPDIFVQDQNIESREEFYEIALEALKPAVESVGAMRLDEGTRLADDMKERIKTIETDLDEIEEYAKGNVESRFTKLQERVEALLGDSVEPTRLNQELSIIADKLDISEELVRFRSHNVQFLNFIEIDEPIGKRLTFLLQEMNREANTISSKVNDASIARIVVELKNNVEILREQSQNIL